MTANRADIDALLNRSQAADHRAEASEERADAAEARADASEQQVGDVGHRVEKLESRLDVNETVLAELQMEGLVDRDHVVHMAEALRSSRLIGAAIGIIMATHKVSEVEAFAILNRASQNTNRRVRALADEVVSSGDASAVPHG